MKHIVLLGTGLHTSRLGFGCAPIMGRQGKRRSLNALACAYDSGIIHYDVARSYGFGEAEGIVGRFIRDKRDKVCLVTKFGIIPRAVNPVLRLAMPYVRSMLDIAPSLRGRVRKAGNRFLAPGDFTVEAARSSLHTSLIKLGVDTIDLLLLHEVNMRSVIKEDLFDFLDRCVAEGKIRGYGIATDSASANSMLEKFPFGSISAVQVPLKPGEEFTRLGSSTPDKAHIVHSVAALQPALSAGIGKMTERQEHLPDEITKARLEPAQAMSLLIRYACAKTQGGVTLVSSFNPRHIVKNARAVETPLPEDSIHLLDKMLFS